MSLPRLGLIGVHGYGSLHLREVARLAAAGRARLVACADVKAPAAEAAATLEELGAEYWSDWKSMLDEHEKLDVVVVATPPHRHAEMAVAAMERGAHVLVEKPPVVTLEDFEGLLGTADRRGVACQVGFQSTASGALGRFRELRSSEVLGDGAAIGATGRWQRDFEYWSRASWAGKESLAGAPVRDGALTNPFAHAVMNCLVVAGTADIEAVEVERFRANPIEVDDTGCLRVTMKGGQRFVVAVTLCAEDMEPPALRLSGPKGSAGWAYESDVLWVRSGSQSWTEAFARRSLLEELLDFVAGRVNRLSCPLSSCRRFVELVEVIHAAPVVDIAADFVRWTGEAGRRRPAIAGIDRAVAQSVEEQRLFSELGPAVAPFARLSGRPVATAPGLG